MSLTLHHAPSSATIPVSVTGKSGCITDDIRNFARQRLLVALRRRADRVRSADVWLEDVNGPRGGVDKRCRIQLRLNPRGRVTVTAIAANEFAAVAGAARRAAAQLDRKSKRVWTSRRGSRVVSHKA